MRHTVLKDFMCLALFLFLRFLFIYFERERERKRDQERGRERGRERIPSRFCTAGTEPHVGLELTNREIMT